MFGWIGDFYKRHRKKILFTGVLAGGTYVISKYVSWKFEEWQDAKMLEYTQETKKQYHFESNQRTCTMTFMSFLPNIRTAIIENINTEDLLDQLKSKPDNKIEIWEQLKILSMSRLLCAVVANVSLLVFLKVELNIIGGHLFKNSTQEEDEGAQSNEMHNVQVKYLNNVRYFMEVQLPILIDQCIEAVTETVANIPLKEKISFEKLRQIINDVKLQLISKNYIKDGNVKHPFSAYMVDPEWESILDNDFYSKMTSETVNVLECADCAKVINKCVDVGLDQILNHLESSFHGNEEDPEAIVSLEIKRDFYKPRDLPFAKIIPLLNGQIHEIFKAGSNDFLDVVFSESVLREFSTNIYDAFSKEYS